MRRQSRAPSGTGLFPFHTPIETANVPSWRSSRYADLVSSGELAPINWNRSKEIKGRKEITAVAELGARFGLTRLGAAVLNHRKADPDEYLTVDFDSLISRMGYPKGADEIAELIFNARFESIALAVDYDVDGTCSGAILSRILTGLNIRHKIYSPDRGEGHGLNERLVREIAADGHKLLICQDFGTQNHTQLALAKSLGLKTAVIDHHFIGTGPWPPVDALANPYRADCGYADHQLSAGPLSLLCGMRTIEYCAESNSPTLRERAKNIQIKPLFAYAWMSIIADMVPLQDLNRAICRVGAPAFANSPFGGLRALAYASRSAPPFLASTVGFTFGPIINAASRMANRQTYGRSGAHLALDLLLEDDYHRGLAQAELLCALNSGRKELQASYWPLAEEKVAEVLDKHQGLPPIVVIEIPDVQPGFAGLLAGHILERFGRPAFVLSPRENGFLSGSARSRLWFPIGPQFEELAKFGLNGGGHIMVGGFSVHRSKFAQVEAELFRRASDLVPSQIIKPVSFDAMTSLRELRESGPRLNDDLLRMEPFGQANKPLAALIPKVQVVASRTLGSGRHLELTVRESAADSYGGTEDNYAKVFWWNRPKHPLAKVGSEMALVAGLMPPNTMRNPEDQNFPELELITAEPSRSP